MAHCHADHGSLRTGMLDERRQRGRFLLLICGHQGNNVAGNETEHLTDILSIHR